jgi:hypothetical protein
MNWRAPCNPAIPLAVIYAAAAVLMWRFVL